MFKEVFKLKMVVKFREVPRAIYDKSFIQGN
jgi:hypothetical protein